MYIDICLVKSAVLCVQGSQHLKDFNFSHSGKKFSIKASFIVSFLFPFLGQLLIFFIINIQNPDHQGIDQKSDSHQPQTNFRQNDDRNCKGEQQQKGLWKPGSEFCQNSHIPIDQIQKFSLITDSKGRHFNPVQLLHHLILKFSVHIIIKSPLYHKTYNLEHLRTNLQKEIDHHHQHDPVRISLGQAVNRHTEQQAHKQIRSICHYRRQHKKNRNFPVCLCHLKITSDNL